MTRPRMSGWIGGPFGFLMLMLGFAVGAVLLGYWPTRRLGGPGAVRGMYVGCGISLIASWMGAIPLLAARRGPSEKVPQAVLTATVVRFLVVLVLALSAALCGWFDRPAVLVWVAISYLLLLVADTLFAVRLGGASESPG